MPTATSPSARASGSVDTYVVSIETEVTQNGKPVQAYPAWPAGFGDQTTGPLYASALIDYRPAESVERLAAEEGQQRQHLARALQLGWPAGPVLRRHFPARQSGYRRRW